jgi:cellulose synthase/poly-beta-1,6-N-acetylglucosamine synthase-like glycosyltransferase
MAAIESVRNQNYPAREIVVVDDGSTDGSVDNLRAVSGITLIEQANGGPGSARNRGARAGDAELIAFLDHDDTWRPNKLAVQVRMFEDPTVALVHSAGHLYDRRSGWESDGYVGDDVGFHDVLDYKIPGIQTVVVRRAIFEEVGGFDESMFGPDDWDFLLKVAAKHRMLGTPEVLVDVDAVPGLGARVRPMFEGQLRAIAKARSVHPGCATCARIAAHTERAVRMYAVETEKAKAARLWNERKRLQAAWVRVAAYRYDPVAATRLPKRALRRALRRRADAAS